MITLAFSRSACGGPMKRTHRLVHPALLGSLLAALPVWLATAAPLPSVSAPPLAGVLRSLGQPVSGGSILIRSVAGGVAGAMRTLKTDREGVFVWPGAEAGVYAVVAIVPGFRPAVARVEHRAGDGGPTFVALDLEADPNVLPDGTSTSDPWVARAATAGDPLRDVEAVALPDTAQPVVRPLAREDVAAILRPLRASVASLAGMDISGPVLSRTSLDLSGRFGEGLHWGLEGAYRQVSASGGPGSSDASEIALEVGGSAMSPVHGADAVSSLRLASRQQSLEIAPEQDESSFSAHSLDWVMPTGQKSEAGVSARYVTQANLGARGIASELFARSSNAFEVRARYRADFSEGRGVRVSVSYRADIVPTGAGVPAGSDVRETRIGGAATFRVVDGISVEGGVTGDSSALGRGLTPEVRVSWQPAPGAVVWLAAAQRFATELASTIPAVSASGTEEADLSRLCRSAYRFGIRMDAGKTDGIWVELSRKELGTAYRFLIDPEFLDRIDSVYFFPGDVVVEVATGATVKIGRDLAARISATVGRVDGTGTPGYPANDALFGRGEAFVRVNPSGTEVGVGYRVVQQNLARSDAASRNEIEAVELSASQIVPIPVLRALGSDLRVLLALELGQRQDGSAELLTDRRLSGGLGVSF